MAKVMHPWEVGYLVLMPLDFSQTSGAPGVQRAPWVQVRISSVVGPPHRTLASTGSINWLRGQLWVNLSILEQVASLSLKGMSVPHLCGWAISEIHIYDLTKISHFLPYLIISRMMPALSSFYAYLWKTFIYLVVSLYSLPSLVPGQIFGLQVTEGAVSTLAHTHTVWRGPGSSGWRTHLFLGFNARCLETLPIITSFTTLTNTFWVHYTISGSLLPMSKQNLTILPTAGFSQEQFQSREREGPLSERRQEIPSIF